MIRWLWFLVALSIGVGVGLNAQTAGGLPRPLRVYVFDGGRISGFDIKMFGFARGELKEPALRIASYLVVHPRGALMFDSQGIPDAAFPADGSPAKEGPIVATTRLLPQLASAGYAPSDIQYFALSHYHSDHTANANAFAGATWIVQKAERDAMFAEKPDSTIRPTHFSALRAAKTVLLDNADFDVFGDGTVVVLSTPGHTPGHQSLFVKLSKTGPVLLAGDLYHYPEERTTGNVPTFEFNAEQSRASRAKMEALLKRTGARLWLEHDIATHQDLPAPPKYLD